MAQQFGNFGGQTGLSMDNIMAAMERRRMGGSAPQLDQVTSGASGFSGPAIPRVPSMNGTAPVSMNQLPNPENTTNSQSDIIVKALTQRLGTLNKVDDPKNQVINPTM